MIFVRRGATRVENGFFCFIYHLLVFCRQADLQTTSGGLTVVVGETTVLPCVLGPTTESLDQISWQKKTRGTVQKVNFYTIQIGGPQFVGKPDFRFTFTGNYNDKVGNLTLTGVKLEDEGTYICIFSVFPSGHREKVTTLNVLVPPSIRLVSVNPTLGDKEVTLATCIAAGAKPPAEVRWETSSLGDKVTTMTNETVHANGTVTTVCSLLGKPTFDIYKQVVQCVVTSEALKETKTLPFQVKFPPMNVTISEGPEENTFECSAEANPPAATTWRRINKPFPESVKNDAPKLQFPKMTNEMNGLYECVKKNDFGESSSYIFIHGSDTGYCTVCWTLFSLLVITIITAVAALYFRKPETFQSVFRWKRGPQAVPTNGSPEQERSL